MHLWGDATGSIIAKVGTKIILHYSFLLCDKTRNSEPLANTEILTDSLDDLPIRHCLNQFIFDEKRKFGHNSNTVPVLFTCDMSWPILKSAICCFNNESVEEYLSWSYRISNGRSSDLHIKPSKLFLHFCLLHITHAFSRRLESISQDVRKILSCTAAVSLPIQKNGQFSGKTFTASLFYYFRTTKQIKLDYTLNA